PQPGGEVDPERGLLVGRRAGVVAQGVDGAVVVAAAVLVGQGLHREVLALLGPRRQDVLGLLLAAQPAAAADGAGGGGGDGWRRGWRGRRRRPCPCAPTDGTTSRPGPPSRPAPPAGGAST